MNLKTFLKSELQGWGRLEKIIFPIIIIVVISISLYLKDSKIALISAICGISYTILAGKGKISCYIIGLGGTFCYALLAYKNALYGNLLLYILYYFPMQVFGIFKWRQHLRPDSLVIYKTKLEIRNRIIFASVSTVISVIAGIILNYSGDTTPYIDAVCTVFSVTGLILTVNRCIEQWYVWILVNGLSALMWIKIYILTHDYFATVLMWITYFILALYFLRCWNKELQ